MFENFVGKEKTPNCIIVWDCARDWQMSHKWQQDDLPTIFGEGVLVEVCVCCGNELSSKINAYFSYNWFSSFGGHSIIAKMLGFGMSLDKEVVDGYEFMKSFWDLFGCPTGGKKAHLSKVAVVEANARQLRPVNCGNAPRELVNDRKDCEKVLGFSENFGVMKKGLIYENFGIFSKFF